MTVLRLEQIGIVVRDLAAAKAFFIELGLELEGEAVIEGSAVDRLNGIEGVRSDIAVMRTPDGHGKLELIKWHTPSVQDGDPTAPPNSSANWCGTRTVTGSPTSAVPRGSSSSWRKRSPEYVGGRTRKAAFGR